MVNLGNKIRAIRLELGETMEEFGLRFNTSKGTVNNWEKDRNKPNKENLKIIADIANVSVKELLYGNSEIKNPPYNYLTKELMKFTDNKGDFFNQESSLLVKSGVEGIFNIFGVKKDLDKKALAEYNDHRKKVKKLKQYGEQYIEDNYKDYTFDKYLKDFPNSTPQDFQEYKEHEWDRLKNILEDYWDSFDISITPYEWINDRFTDQIKEELYEISNKAIDENKEHYYVNELVQPFLDQAAKDFKEYIKENTDIEE